MLCDVLRHGGILALCGMRHADNFPAESLLFNKRQENRREFEFLRQENRRNRRYRGEVRKFFRQENRRGDVG